MYSSVHKFACQLTRNHRTLQLGTVFLHATSASDFFHGIRAYAYYKDEDLANSRSQKFLEMCSLVSAQKGALEKYHGE